MTRSTGLHVEHSKQQGLQLERFSGWIVLRCVGYASCTPIRAQRAGGEIDRSADSEPSAVLVSRLPVLRDHAPGNAQAGLNIELRDAKNDPRWEQELIEQGGKRQVPCLRINNEDGKTALKLFQPFPGIVSPVSAGVQGQGFFE